MFSFCVLSEGTSASSEATRLQFSLFEAGVQVVKAGTNLLAARVAGLGGNERGHQNRGRDAIHLDGEGCST